MSFFSRKSPIELGLNKHNQPETAGVDGLEDKPERQRGHIDYEEVDNRAQQRLNRFARFAKRFFGAPEEMAKQAALAGAERVSDKAKEVGATVKHEAVTLAENAGIVLEGIKSSASEFFQRTKERVGAAASAIAEKAGRLVAAGIVGAELAGQALSQEVERVKSLALRTGASLEEIRAKRKEAWAENLFKEAVQDFSKAEGLRQKAAQLRKRAGVVSESVAA